jgi:hypothetical protein
MSVQGTTAEATGKSAQHEGQQLAQSAKDSSTQVAQTVKEEAANVAGEVKSQVRSLAGEARDQVGGRIEQQKSTAVSALRTSADELHSLTSDGGHSRLTSELTRRAAEQAHSIADYLDAKGPSDILDDVRSFARRKPGMFLLAAGLAGVVVGRVVRGTVAASSPSDSPRQLSTSGGYGTNTGIAPGYSTTPGYTEPVYTEPAYTEPLAGEPATGYEGTYSTGTTYAGSTYGTDPYRNGTNEDLPR